MSRRARQRRDKRAPIPDFDDPQPRMPGLFISGAINYAARGLPALADGCLPRRSFPAAGVTRGPLSALAWISRSREWAWVDALHQPSRDVLVLH